jgi:hypothetical protein
MSRLLATAFIASLTLLACASRLPAQQGPSGDVLILKNASTDTLRVEMHTARDAQCGTASARVVQQRIPPGRAWGITARTSVCWRRTGGTWQRHQPTGRRETVSLP